MSIESYCAEPTGSPENTSYAWDISHALVTTYHPYSHSPSELTEYLKRKLHSQRAKRLGRSPPTQVESNVQLERNSVPSSFAHAMQMQQTYDNNDYATAIITASRTWRKGAHATPPGLLTPMSQGQLIYTNDSLAATSTMMLGW